MTTVETTSNLRTLNQRLQEGRIPVSEGLRYAALLAEALRKMHDEGRPHGAITTESILLTTNGLDLLPPAPGIAALTPYTAPEVALEHRPADARSDVFSFGVVVYEILTGRRAFEGDTEASLVASLCSSPAPASGSAAVDRLVGGCLAKDPAARWQRMQKIQLELKLLTAAARRSNSTAPVRRDPGADASLRAEMQQLEARVSSKLEAHERAVIDIQRAATDAVNTLRGQLSAVGAQLAAAQERASKAEPAVELIGERIMAQVQQSADAVNQRIAALEESGGGERALRMEHAIESLTQQLAQLHENVAEDLREFEVTLKTQSSAVESARTAMAQTDDLVERVVEALESLQSTVLEQSDERAMAFN
jgi:hypothetical protein